MEIKRIGPRSAFKATLYIASVPLALLMVIGVLLTIVGASIGNTNLLIAGIPYIVMSIFMVFIYGLISMLASLVYNKFAGKYGGLELEVQVEEERTEQLEV
jgi:uncharacterized membrane protein